MFAAAADFVLAGVAFGTFSLVSAFVADAFAVDFFDEAAAVCLLGACGVGTDAAELLRRPRPCELDESESELDELESESLELPLDDDEPELLQLESVVVTD